MTPLLATLVLAAAPVPTQPTLTPPQAAALRCGVAFALGARMQADGDPAAAAWPALGTRGKEYFVRVTARLMDDTAISRDTLAALTTREVKGLSEPGALSSAMTNCLPLLDAAGL